jgi:hypothetical protein
MVRKKHTAHFEGDDSEVPVELSESRQNSPEVTENAPPSPPADAVKVMLLGDHVYLPEDPTADDWASARVTVRYDGVVNERRARVTVHPSLAAFLQKRGQAEILD